MALSILALGMSALAADESKEISGSLPPAWSDFYKVYKGGPGDSSDVLQSLKPLVQSRQEGVRVEAMHLYARVLWEKEDKASRKKALAIWKKLESSTRNANLKRLLIAQALQAEVRGKPDEAIETLQKVVNARLTDPCTLEAAIELARLQGEADYKKAQATCEFILTFSEKISKGGEFSKVAVQPFVDKAAQLKEHFSKSPAEWAFLAAERLRKAKKYDEAIRAYRDIVKQYSDSVFAPRSEMSVGLCLLDQGKINSAVKHWKTFIEKASAGPWRGQAFLHLIDLFLTSDEQDIEQADRYARLAQGAVKTALASKDRQVVESWEPVALDLQLRLGLLAYARGEFPAAAKALKEALKNKGLAKEQRAALDRLIAAAEANKPTLPDDVRDATSRDRQGAGLSLALGTVYNLMGRHEQAEKLFENVLAGKTGKVEAVQHAYAEFGYAVAQQSQGQHRRQDAKANFINSIKTYKEGSWHDETLFNLAALTLQQAETKYNQESRARKEAESSKKPNKTKRQTEADRKQAEADEKKHLATLQQSRLGAMPYLQELITRYPKSPRLPEALYQLGLLQTEQAETAANSDQNQTASGAASRAKAVNVEKLFKAAAATLTKFTTDYPASPHAGDAHVKLIDIQLERLFDLPAAQTSANKAVAWAKQHEPKNKKPTKADNNTDKPNLPLWATQSSNASTAIDLRTALYNTYLRAGLVAYLNQKYDAAIILFKTAKPFEPPPDFVVVAGNVPTGIERVIAAAKGKKLLIPPEILKMDQRANLAMQLISIYQQAGVHEKALVIADELLRKPGKAASVQLSWVHYRRGRSLYYLEEDPVDAKKSYLASLRLSPKTEWAGDAIFLAANITYNHEENVNEAVKLWQKAIAEYPDNEEAERSAYYVGIAYEWANRHEEAIKAYENALAKFPGGEFEELIRNHLAKMQKKMGGK
jgi:tetratricopeptide (TPR) repeat protein